MAESATWLGRTLRGSKSAGVILFENRWSTFECRVVYSRTISKESLMEDTYENYKFDGRHAGCNRTVL